MDAGDGLHSPAVTMPQAVPVNMFHAAYVGRSVFGDGYAVIAINTTGHAGVQQDFIIQMFVNKLVYLMQIRQRVFDIGKRRRNEFNQRFGIVRGDRRMR